MKLSEKTGFYAPNPVVVMTPEHDFFYKSKGGKFNLPKGDYLMGDGVEKLQKPVVFKKLRLPRPERSMKPKVFSIEYESNPRLATIDHRRGLIILDQSLKNKPVLRDFVLGHEIAHRRYSSEPYCDQYAYNRMIEKGYNPDQIIDLVTELRGGENVLVKSLKAKANVK